MVLTLAVKLLSSGPRCVKDTVAGASCAVLCGPCRIASLTDATVSCLLTLQNRLDHIDPALRRPGRFDREAFCRLGAF